MPQVNGKAFYLSSTKCDRPLVAGTVYMTRTSVSSSARSIIVKRGTTVLSHGDSYAYNETLTVTLSATNGQYCFETDNAVFQEPANAVLRGCNNKRLANTPIGSIVVPASGTLDVSIWVGWTTSSTVPVSIIANKFVLKPPPTDAPTEAPTEAPTAVPTEAPSALPTIAPIGPTHSPVLDPTEQPTITQTPTHSPTTHLPTQHPSRRPTSHVPTHHPTAMVPVTESEAQVNNVESLSDKSTPEKVIAGVLIGIASAMILLYGTFQLANRIVLEKESDSEKQAGGTKEPIFTFAKFTAVLALCMVVLAIILVSKWASTGNRKESDPAYLGEPSWEKNAKAYHVVLMVGGFYSSQIIAISSWTLIPNRIAAKVIHASAQAIGLAMMIAGLWSILKHKFTDKSPNFSSMHSWIGIAAISMYGLNIAWGTVMATLTQVFPDSVLRRAFDLGSMHKMIGTFALWMVNISVFSGIMSHLPYGACFDKEYINIGYKKPDYDSAKNYDDIPDGCKIGHGLGIAVLTGTIAIMLAVSFRVNAGNAKLNSAMIFPQVVPVKSVAAPASSYEVACSSPSNSKRELPL